jgi:hypothetical protein
MFADKPITLRIVISRTHGTEAAATARRATPLAVVGLGRILRTTRLLHELQPNRMLTLQPGQQASGTRGFSTRFT